MKLKHLTSDSNDLINMISDCTNLNDLDRLIPMVKQFQAKYLDRVKLKIDKSLVLTYTRFLWELIDYQRIKIKFAK